MVGEACLPSNAYYPRTPDYTLCSGVHVCWSEHSDSSFVYGFMILNYGFGTMTATTRCMTYVEKELKLSVIQKTIWLNSQCVLGWIESKKSLATFVENRVKEIKRHKDIEFHYISTKENPADIASRGMSTKELQFNRLWWNGPDWLLNRSNE